jgi:type IV pilus assembly protein PilV
MRWSFYMNNGQKTSRLIDGDDGFTLIEILIAIAIFAIGILAIASVQIWNVKNNTTGNITTMATMLARQKMEEIKNVSDITELDSSPFTDSSCPGDPERIDLEGNPNPNGVFERCWDISEFSNPNWRYVRVEVYRRGKEEMRVALESITRGNGL